MSSPAPLVILGGMEEADDYADGGPPYPAGADRRRELFALAVVTFGPLVVMSNLLLLAYLFSM